MSADINEAAAATEESGLQWLLGRDASLLDRAADQFDFPYDALRVIGASRTLGAVVAHYEASVWKGVGLTAPQGWLVMKLFLAGPTGQSEIAEDLMVTRSSVSQLADRLVAMGLVSREPSASDRRVSLLGLTEGGREKVFSVLPAIRAALRGVGERLEPDELAALFSGLQKLSEVVSESGKGVLPPE